jgi:hypothetical protein
MRTRWESERVIVLLKPVMAVEGRSLASGVLIEEVEDR